MGLLGLTSREVDQTERDRLRQAALPVLESEALRPADFTIRDDRVNSHSFVMAVTFILRERLLLICLLRSKSLKSLLVHPVV
jgi:hypothetical protein